MKLASTVFPKEIPPGLPPLRGIEHQTDLGEGQGPRELKSLCYACVVGAQDGK